MPLWKLYLFVSLYKTPLFASVFLNVSYKFWCSGLLDSQDEWRWWTKVLLGPFVLIDLWAKKYSKYGFHTVICKQKKNGFLQLIKPSDNIRNE